jgi:hypothetical protein
MGPGLEIQTFDRRGLLGRRFYFRIVDTGNWETLAASEAYNRAQSRDKTANRLAKVIGCAVPPERRNK